MCVDVSSEGETIAWVVFEEDLKVMLVDERGMVAHLLDQLDFRLVQDSGNGYQLIFALAITDLEILQPDLPV